MNTEEETSAEPKGVTVGDIREALAGLPDEVAVNISVSNAGGDGVLSFWTFGISDYSDGGQDIESGWVEFMMLDEDNQELCPAELSPGVLV